MISLPDEIQHRIDCAVAGLDGWLETMRQPGGYGGPVAHWWEHCLLYAGPMADWRYEGILCGYVNLYRCTQNDQWLERAVRAGDDLVAAQLPTGKFRNSSFQQGPMEGGTPHESAVDVGLFELALLLRERGDPQWERYYQVARRNVIDYQVGQLWNGNAFLDQPWNQTVVPNKNGTLIEALVLYETISGEDVGPYILGAAQTIASAQEKAGPRQGGIVHLGTGQHRLAIGIYNARSVCGLLRAYEREQHREWLDVAAQSLQFIAGLFTDDGICFGRYPEGRVIANPRIISGSGDILRAFLLGEHYGLIPQVYAYRLLELLLQHQTPTGALPTAVGLAKRGSVLPYRGLVEFTDLLPVVGWVDKTFRALSLLVSPQVRLLVHECTEDYVSNCLWKGELCSFSETHTQIKLVGARDARIKYQWFKNSAYPRAYVL